MTPDHPISILGKGVDIRSAIALRNYLNNAIAERLLPTFGFVWREALDKTSAMLWCDDLDFRGSTIFEGPLPELPFPLPSHDVAEDYSKQSPLAGLVWQQTDDGFLVPRGHYFAAVRSRSKLVPLEPNGYRDLEMAQAAVCSALRAMLGIANASPAAEPKSAGG